MARSINLDRVELVEISGSGMILEVRKDEKGQLLVRVESGMGGRRIIIKQHPDDARTIVYSLEDAQPPEPLNPGLSLVK